MAADSPSTEVPDALVNLVHCELPPNVGVRILRDDSTVYFQVRDARGHQALPIYDGTVTPSEMPFIKNSLKDLVQINGDIQVAWPLAQCKLDPARPFLIKCEGEGQIQLPADSKLATYSLHTEVDHQDDFDQTYDVVRFNWGVDNTSVDRRHHALSFPFAKSQCRASSSANEIKAENP